MLLQGIIMLSVSGACILAAVGLAAALTAVFSLSAARAEVKGLSGDGVGSPPPDSKPYMPGLLRPGEFRDPALIMPKVWNGEG